MTDSVLPLFTRWSLYALGAVEGSRIRAPRDPVAAWLLKQNPELHPTVRAPSKLARMRATTALVDGLIAEEVDRAKRDRVDLTYWAFGASFDARWYRLMPLLAGVVRRHVEVEVPRLLHVKSGFLDESAYSSLWEAVEKQAIPEERWTISADEGCRPLVVLEGLWWRLDPETLEILLDRILLRSPDAVVITDLPGEGALVEGPWWSKADLEAMGWMVDADYRLYKRPRLMTRAGAPICGGMEAFRLVRLRASTRS